MGHLRRTRRPQPQRRVDRPGRRVGAVRDRVPGALCERTGQPVPGYDLAIVRCILDSLALRYRAVMDSLEALTGPIRTIHIVGGGVNNAALCQFTAEACRRDVTTGPVEATAVGNALVQAMAMGRIGSLAELRDIVAASTRCGHHEPTDKSGAWEAAYQRFKALLPRP